MDLIRQRIQESIAVKQRILADDYLMGEIAEAAALMRKCLASGGKLLFCGNGGSASDALHLAGEFVGRFQKERRALPAISLNADVSVMTSVANDYGFDTIFSRAAEGLMEPSDVLIGISTSGKSENVYQAIRKGRELGGGTIALLGKNGGKVKDAADISIVVPDTVTARIQESHIMIGHILCELAEL